MRMRKKSRWVPAIGQLAQYIGDRSRLSKGGHTVRVVAEASGKRFIVEAIGLAGTPVRVTVKAVNLGPMPRGLFDFDEPVPAKR